MVLHAPRRAPFALIIEASWLEATRAGSPRSADLERRESENRASSLAFDKYEF